jgi:large subunit ribosomal protein L6
MEKEKIKGIVEEIEVPKDLTLNMERNSIIIKKGDKELKRKIGSLVEIKINNNKIILSIKKTSKNEKKELYTLKAHIKNMIKGLNEGFKYTLQVANVHFPITVKFDKTTNEIIVKNFLGEKIDRKIKVNPDVEIKLDKDIIELESFDIEKAGQLAANIEKKTKVRNKDRRVFQDGIFITQKPGRAYT